MINNRKVQFAVGLTAIFIAICWPLTGDLLMAVEAAKPPAEGETKVIQHRRTNRISPAARPIR